MAAQEPLELFVQVRILAPQLCLAEPIMAFGEAVMAIRSQICHGVEVEESR